MSVRAQEPVAYSLNPSPVALPAGTALCGRFIEREVLVETDVSEPSLTFWPPADSRPGRPAVIVCPGGGYEVLATEHEGAAVARWLNSLGVAAFVLRYRVPAPGHPAPLTDARAAVRLVRERGASVFGVDRERVGMLGFSAGGHLAGAAGLLSDENEGTTRPDFLLLIYPVATLCEAWGHAGSRQALLGPSAPVDLAERLSLERCTGPDSPPVFLVHAADDDLVPVENSLRLCSALARAGRPVELHVYERGGHGFGLGAAGEPAADWPHRAEAWLRSCGWLEAGADAG